jgi:hypothetical protein
MPKSNAAVGVNAPTEIIPVPRPLSHVASSFLASFRRLTLMWVSPDPTSIPKSDTMSFVRLKVGWGQEDRSSKRKGPLTKLLNGKGPPVPLDSKRTK